MKQAFFPALHEMPIVREDYPIPSCGDGEILLKVKMASVCNLTDIHTIEGLHPPHNVWEEGHFVNPPNAFPAPIGHEGAGEVIEVGRGVKGVGAGDRVCTMHASAMFAEYAVVEPHDIAKLPDHVSWEEAAPTELLMCMFPLVQETVRMGDSVVILGQGASGLLATQCAKLAGAQQVITVEPQAFKRDLSKKLGASEILDPNETDVWEAVLDLTRGVGVNTVLECVGIPETIALTTRLIMKRRLLPGDNGSNIAIFGACRHPVPFDFMELHWKEARVFTVGSSRYGYSNFALERCVEFIASGQVQMKPLLTHKLPLTEISQAFDLIMHNRDQYVKVLIDPNVEAQEKGDGCEQYRVFQEYR